MQTEERKRNLFFLQKLGCPERNTVYYFFDI